MPPPDAAQREAGPQHARQTDLFDDAESVRQRPGHAALRHLHADLEHGVLELLAVLGLVDHVGPRADHLDAVLLEDAVLEQVHRGVEAGLPAERGQKCVRPFLGDDLLDDLPGDRLDVGAVGRLRIGHDRGRVGVDQHDRVAFLAEGLASLRAGVIELAGLADDDRPGADEQDFVEVGAFRHGGESRPGVEGRANSA